jgi:glycosyltransferase involved in cell wall biosynthesis
MTSGQRGKPGSICIIPRLERMGGPASFQNSLMAGLRAGGFEVHHNPQDPSCAALLVNGGTSRLQDIWRARRRGVRVVQRLNGINWLHRRQPTGLRHYLRSEWGNWVLAVIRRFLADQIVYQSNFSHSWWETVYGQIPVDHRVVYNAVDLAFYHPEGRCQRPQDHIRLLLVEGHLGSGYEQGLENAIRLAQELDQGLRQRVELVVVGDVPLALQQQCQKLGPAWITWMGVQPRQEIPAIDRSAHLLFSADLNAACPNAVIEALACGLPVIGFATGSLPELIDEHSGQVAPYGSNFWKLEQPDIPALAEAAMQVLGRQDEARRAARRRAEEKFGLDTMVAGYLDALLG